MPTLSIIDSERQSAGHLIQSCSNKQVKEGDFGGVNKFKIETNQGKEGDRENKKQMNYNDSQATVKTILTPKKQM